MLAALRHRAPRPATYTVTINPLVNWIWLGFAVLAFGTGIALLPETRVRVRGVRCRKAR